MNRGGYGGPHHFQPRAQNFAPRFFNNAPRQPVEPAGKVVAFDQCREEKITPASDNQQLLINSYDLKRPGRDVIQYELKFIADYGLKKIGESKPIEYLSDIPTEHVLASVRKICLTRLYELLFQQHGTYFEANKLNKNGMYEHVYVYDRTVKFYCSLEMQDRGLQNPFIIDISSMTPDLFGHLCNPVKVIATLKQTQKLDSNTTNAAEMSTYLEALFCQHQLDGPEQFVKFGSKMFDLQSKVDITGGCELTDGHHKSVRIAENVAELQIGAKISPFHQKLPFLHYLEVRFGLGPHDDFCSHSVIEKLASLNGLFVRTIHKSNNEIFRIHGITSIPANQLTFEDRNGTRISVATYYETFYKKELEFPHFPCVIQKIGKDKVTKKEIHMHYPFEVLEVQQGQKFPKDVMNNNQEQNMIKAAQRLPGTMIKAIENQKKLANIFDEDQYVSAAQVQIAPNMKTVKAEVLNAPVITYKNDVTKQVDYGVWDLRGVGFVKPVEINALAIFYNNVPHNTVLEVAHKIHIQAKILGMEIHSKECFGLTNEQLNASYLEETILRYRDEVGVDFVLAFVSGSEFHNILKATEIVTNVPTQQVEPKTVTNPKLGAVTLGNVIQKMNLKYGGYNQYFQQAVPSQVNGERIDLFQSFLQDTMVMGFYMSHPSPGSSEDFPSVCGYSFTTNKRGNVARGGFVYTKPRQYILSEDELRKPLEDAVKLYFQENGSYPQRVLVYRFGTSDGEIEKIRAEECEFMMNELTAAMNGKTPKLTVIAVRRKHHTRVFKQLNQIDPLAKAPFQNVTPGTCVPGTTESDIFMVPHRELQGTAKPTVFSTVFPSSGDADLTPHFLRNITHAFCYMDETVNSAISVPHTIQSAEQLANRGSKLWHSKNKQLDYSEEDKIYSRATTALNPQIASRYWA
uniref:Uncharacterized protein n=1 Tax=Panagrolaimus davidi TaxID=227884 RepID=A0A914QP64_9BILA